MTVTDNSSQILCTNKHTKSLESLVVCWEPSTMTGNLPLPHHKEFSLHKYSVDVCVYIYTYIHIPTHTIYMPYISQLEIYLLVDSLSIHVSVTKTINWKRLGFWFVSTLTSNFL